MADGWANMATSDTLATSRATINTGFTELTNLHKGASEPTNKVDGMLWYDSANGSIKLYDGSGAAWRTIVADITASQGGVAAVASDNAFSSVQSGTDATSNLHFPTAQQVNGQRQSVVIPIAGISASTEIYGWAIPESAKYEIVAAYIISNTATTGSDGSNNYAFSLDNLTSAVSLCSSSATTNGAEIAAEVRYSLGVDQNNAKANLDAGDLIVLTVSKTGTPTSLASAMVALQIDYKVHIF